MYHAKIYSLDNHDNLRNFQTDSRESTLMQIDVCWSGFIGNKMSRVECWIVALGVTLDKICLTESGGATISENSEGST